MILNRIGDFGLVIGILIVFVEYKAIDYATVFAITPVFTNRFFNFLTFDVDLISIICFFLIYRCYREISTIRPAYVIT